MPIEDLLALYGYGGEGEQQEVPLEEIRPEPLHPFPSGKTNDQVKSSTGPEKEEDSRSVSSESSRISTAQSSNSHEENGYDPFQNQRITRGSKLDSPLFVAVICFISHKIFYGMALICKSGYACIVISDISILFFLVSCSVLCFSEKIF